MEAGRTEFAPGDPCSGSGFGAGTTVSGAMSPEGRITLYPGAGNFTMLVGGAATMDLISTAANAAFWVDAVAAPLLAVFPVPDEP